MRRQDRLAVARRAARIASHSASSSLPGLSRIWLLTAELADVVQQRRPACSQRRCCGVEAHLLGDHVGEERDALAVAGWCTGSWRRPPRRRPRRCRRDSPRRRSSRAAGRARARSTRSRVVGAASRPRRPALRRCRSKASTICGIEPAPRARLALPLRSLAGRRWCGTRRRPGPAARCARRAGSPRPCRPSGLPPPFQCSSRSRMPCADAVRKNASSRAISAPRWQRVSISSRAISPPLLEDVDDGAEAFGQARPSGRCGTRTKRSTCGRLPSIGLKSRLKAEVVGEVELADARGVAAAAEILQEQRVVEVGSISSRVEADAPGRHACRSSSSGRHARAAAPRSCPAHGSARR